MKRNALMVSILLMLAMAGCSHTTDTASKPDAETTVNTETTPQVPSDTAAAETTATVTEAPMETTIESTETTAAASTTDATQTTAASDTTNVSETKETRPVSKNPQDLIGKWQFPDGYNLKFLENNVVELSIDFSHQLQFKEDSIVYFENAYPFKVEGDTIKSTGDGKTILEMTATEGADAAAMKGRFSLGMCQVYIDQVIDHTEKTKTYFLELRGGKTYLVMPSSYKAEEGALTMIDEENEMYFAFEIDGNTLTITDVEGYQDVLTKAN